MEKRFIVPAVSFLAAVLIWIVFFVVYLSSSLLQGPSHWLTSGFSLLTGGLVLFSGIGCHRAGGPRVGSIVRGSVLLVLSLLTFWKVGVIEACILLAGSVTLGFLALLAKGQPGTAED